MKDIYKKLLPYTSLILKIISIPIICCVIIISSVIASTPKVVSNSHVDQIYEDITNEVSKNDTSNANAPAPTLNNNAGGVDQNLQSQEQVKDKTTDIYDIDDKIDISFNEYHTEYIGYLDKVAMFEDLYDNRDYDGDGLNDRVYRYLTEGIKNDTSTTTLTNYRVDFGNGEFLEIGGFEDNFTGIELMGYDLTGDGVNEIIFCGKHTACTFPPSGSEIAVFQKMDKGYEMLTLPRPDECETTEKYSVGYSIYIDDLLDNQITIYCPVFDYNETITIDDNIVLDFFKLIGEEESVGSIAWDIDTTIYQEQPALILYINIGSRYYNRDLAVYLTLQDGELKPILMKLV